MYEIPDKSAGFSEDTEVKYVAVYFAVGWDKPTATPEEELQTTPCNITYNIVTRHKAKDPYISTCTIRMAIKGGLVCWLPKTSRYEESAYTHINPYIHLHRSLD